MAGLFRRRYIDEGRYQSHFWCHGAWHYSASYYNWNDVLRATRFCHEQNQLRYLIVRCDDVIVFDTDFPGRHVLYEFDWRREGF